MFDAAALCLLLVAPAPGASVEREVAVPRPGPVAVTLDSHVYDRARVDLGDLRIFDAAGREVPYVLDRARGERVEQHRPLLRDRVFDRGAFARATLDFGARTSKDSLTLVTSGDNFRRRVTVEGREDADASWAVLTDEAYVFAVPGPPPARYETIRLPENEYAQLRVTVHHDAGDPSRIEIREAWVPAGGKAPPDAPLVPRLTRTRNTRDRETYVVLDLGARHQPFGAVVLDVGDRRFWRGVTVESRVEPRAGAPLTWTWLVDAAVWRCLDAARCGAGSGGHESLRIDVSGRARVLRLRIRDQDDAPLDVRAVTVLAPVERVVFDAAPGAAYRLAYGDARRGPPAYDLARTSGDPTLLAEAAAAGTLGEPTEGPRAAVAARPWTERHPQLLWGGLLAVVLALGAVTWQALRAS